jgi:hypothetical protein
MILSQHQAEAVYSAMAALNNVNGRVATVLEFGKESECEVVENAEGQVLLSKDFGLSVETYDNQGAFAAAYNLS